LQLTTSRNLDHEQINYVDLGQSQEPIITGVSVEPKYRSILRSNPGSKNVKKHAEEFRSTLISSFTTTGS
jgi:hypothetical protein